MSSWQRLGTQVVALRLMNWKSKTQSTATCLSTLTAAGSVRGSPRASSSADQKFPDDHMRGRSDHGEFSCQNGPVSHLPLLGSAGVGHGRNANDTWICRQLRGEPLTAAVNARRVPAESMATIK